MRLSELPRKPDLIEVEETLLSEETVRSQQREYNEGVFGLDDDTINDINRLKKTNPKLYQKIMNLD